ncbi:MAG TPA: hypothetical protein VFM25_14310 [Verrucomicrobiae bacterium]|nr:hypothetical protein [Verrucomicrobiae bacterium]
MRNDVRRGNCDIWNCLCHFQIIGAHGGSSNQLQNNYQRQPSKPTNNIGQGLLAPNRPKMNGIAKMATNDFRSNKFHFPIHADLILPQRHRDEEFYFSIRPCVLR